MLLEAAQTLTGYGGDLRPSYTGRSRSNPTAAVVFENDHELFNAIADIMIDCDEDDRQTVAKALKRLTSDSMGKQILYY